MISKDALKEYIEHGTIPGGPLTVHVDITNTCNLNCITCWNYSPYLKEPKATDWKKLKLSLKDFEKIIEDLRAVKVKKLIISGGGEPFTHEGIYDMIALAKKIGFDVTVITNAVLIDVEKLLENAPNKLLVNLCAATAGTYADFHPNRKPGDFDSLCRNLKAINKQIPLNLAMVISNVNYHEVPAMARLAAGFSKARLSFKLASLTGDTARFALSAEQKQTLLTKYIPLCADICRENAVERSATAADDVTKRYSSHKKLRKKTRFSPNSSIEHNLDVFRSQLSGRGLEYPIHETGCFAGLFYSRIYSSGDIFFCCAHIKVGNIFEKPFSQIWESDAYHRVRKLMERKEFFPECKRCGKYNLNYQAHLFEKRWGQKLL